MSALALICFRYCFHCKETWVR